MDQALADQIHPEVGAIHLPRLATLEGSAACPTRVFHIIKTPKTLNYSILTLKRALARLVRTPGTVVATRLGRTSRGYWL